MADKKKNAEAGAVEGVAAVSNKTATPKKGEKAEKREKVKPTKEKAPKEKAPKEKTPKEKKPKEKKPTKEKPAKEKKKSPSLKYLGGLLFKKMAFGGAKELSSNAEEVNKLNVFPVPDGDTGDNMRMTIESGILEIESVETDNIGTVIKALSHGMLLGARGNSGVILSQFFAGMAKGLETAEKADAKTFGRALELGVKQAYSSVMTPTEGTILTVAREAVEYAVSRLDSQSTIHTLFADLSAEMNRSLERTPEILAVLKEAGVVDSGAAGLYYIIDGFNRVLNGKKIKGNAEIAAHTAKSAAPTGSFGPDSKMDYGYCTEFLLQLQNAKTDIDAFDVDALRAYLSELGDSIVAFKTDSIVKVHVHTLTPEKVIEYARKYGEFLTVKIENMSVQHSDLSEKEEKEEKKEEQAPKAPLKKYGVVTVCNGEGLEALFGDLGADVTVTGGQTHNPSTNDFLEAFGKVSAEHIFVFPNNSNIFMAAQQAADLYKAASVHVMSSKNLGTGYVALSSLNWDEENVESVISCMEEAMARVSAAYVSPSIRDAEMNGVRINNGDTIGIMNKEIVLADPVRLIAAEKLVDVLLSDPDKFMLTVFSGIDANADETRELESYITAKYPSAELYVINGGQEIYPYIFVAE